MDTNKDTKLIGDITELEILTYITKLGYLVSKPFGDRGRYDRIWDIDGELIKVQVKTSRPIDDEVSGIKFSCNSSRRSKGKCKNTRYSCKEIDYFATIYNNKLYLVHVSETANEKILRFTKPKNNQQAKISLASDYEVEKIIEKIKNKHR